jgi:hypothetical protein
MANAIRATPISPNECDSNFDPAVVDGMFAIVRGLHDLEVAVRDGKELP